MQATHERVRAILREIEWLTQNLSNREVAAALAEHYGSIAGLMGEGGFVGAGSGVGADASVQGNSYGVGDSGGVATQSRGTGVSRDTFSARQLAILQGMVEGKTNHDLASDLGFSVSTIRHETMRIYQLLSVSDRREAAREALDQGIL